MIENKYVKDNILIIEVPAFFKKGVREKYIAGQDMIEYKKDIKLDKTILNYIKKAIEWKEEMEKNKLNIRSLSKIKKIDHSSVGRILNLNYLAPDIIENIILGKYPLDRKSVV